MAANDQARVRREATAKEEEASTYRRAADETLGQLDWCVNYLYRIRKPRLAAALDENRRSIRQRMTEPHD
jgi:hypothetical protein